MHFEKQGQVYQLSAKLNLPIGLDEAWKFLSDPSNLKVITPDYMGFHIISKTDATMYAGQMISYKVSPLLGLKLNWLTEITHVEDKKYNGKKSSSVKWNFQKYLIDENGQLIDYYLSITKPMSKKVLKHLAGV